MLLVIDWCHLFRIVFLCAFYYWLCGHINHIHYHWHKSHKHGSIPYQPDVRSILPYSIQNVFRAASPLGTSERVLGVDCQPLLVRESSWELWFVALGGSPSKIKNRAMHDLLHWGCGLGHDSCQPLLVP